MGEPTLVLCHPAVYGLATVQPLLEQLCQDFRIVTWDPRGTGRSDPLPGPYYITDYMKDLRAVIEALGDRAVVMIGNSRGSTVAAHFTTSYPHLVDKLVLAGLTPAGKQRSTDYPHADRLDMEFVARLDAAIAADDWPAVVWAFVTQVCAGEPGCQALKPPMSVTGRGLSRLPSGHASHLQACRITGSSKRPPCLLTKARRERGVAR